MNVDSDIANADLGDDVGTNQPTEEMDTSTTSDARERLHLGGISPQAGGSKDNMDVVMDQDGGPEGEIDPDADDSDVDSDNDQDEEEEEEEEGTTRYTDQLKSDRRIRGQIHSDSVFGAFSFAGEDERQVENAECVKSLVAESQRWVNRDMCNTAVIGTEKEFVCVKFPAIIKNKDRALACLGGVNNILEAMNVGKIDVVFRPEDPYSKPAIGLFSNNKHLLVKCRRRRKKAMDENRPSTSAASEGSEMDDGYEYKVEVLGVVAGIFKFERPFDFQYLPVIKKTDGGEGYRELLSDLVIKFEDERQGFINRDVPLFLPPYVFSRSERPAKYVFQNDENTGEKHIGIARKLRKIGTYRVTFASNDVPDSPHPNAVTLYNTSNRDLEPLTQLFKERPLWSKVGIVSRLQAMSQEQVYMKKHLNMVAYSFSTGPWIHLWCRFGYDPRKHKEAKLYQTIDFRIRKTYNRENVMAKRGMARLLGRQGLKTVTGHALPSMDKMVDKSDGAGENSDGASAARAVDIHYQFHPDQIPPHRQMFYQVCDVIHEDVQRMVHQNDGKETVCTEKDGWCIPDFLSLSRNILAERSETLMRAKNKKDVLGEGDKDVT